MPEGPQGEICAPSSAERKEAMMATASRVRSWLLIEQPGAWGIDALVESGFDRGLGAALAATCRRHGVRPLLIRRPGRRRLPGARRCFLAHSGARRSWLEVLDLDDPSDLLGLDLTVLASDRAPGVGRARREPIFLVCTNGRHDRCCADFGRPLVRTLAAARGDDVWECSHIGGDRFAANLVCLPEGVYFGRVPPAEGPAIAADYAGGLLALDHYRGRSCYPPFVQAAEQFARRAGGIRGLEGVAVTTVHQPEPDLLDVTVVSTTGGPVWRVLVGRRRSPLAVTLTCRSQTLSRPWEYHVEDMAVVPPGDQAGIAR